MNSDRNPDSDRHLIQRLKRGERAALRELYGAYRLVLFKMLVARTGSADLAEDFVQETFIRVWNTRERLQPSGSFLALLIKISTNLWRDHAKTQAIHARHHVTIRTKQEYLAAKSSRQADQECMSGLLYDHILAVVNESLSEQRRTVFLLSRVAGMTHSEISSLLGISRKAVENHLFRALKTLRAKCGEFL